MCRQGGEGLWVVAWLRNDVGMGGRRRWSGWSWRARVGWGLLGWALLVLCVGLPVWALAVGQLDEVAGWANILALPVTAAGLALVLKDRDQARRASSGVNGTRRPWMAPPLDRMVERPELGGRLVAALTAPGAAEVRLTTGLQGAGGFGKTRLATWVSSAGDRPAVSRWPAVGDGGSGGPRRGSRRAGQRPGVCARRAAGAF
jgi:hypothetical protein